jgi:hypothetical protein
MLKEFKSVILAAVLFPAALLSPAPGLRESADNVPEYRCEIAGYYVQLSDISEVYGMTLLSEDYEEIFTASIDAVAAFGRMKDGLASMAVPAEMREAHTALVNSVDSYGKSADFIRIAVGTSLGKYEETGEDLQGLIDRSIILAVTANEYLEQSLVLHEEVFGLYAGETGESGCGTYASWEGYSVFPGAAGSGI